METKKLKPDEISEKYKAIFVEGCSCPKCGKECNFDDNYFVNGIKYPIYLNHNSWDSFDGEMITWDEVHCCQKCKTMFWFNDGN